MTHDELLAKIDDELVIHGQRGNIVKHSFALSAVVELHRRDVRNNCDLCSWMTNGGAVLYPCPTVQTIEKALL